VYFVTEKVIFFYFEIFVLKWLTPGLKLHAFVFLLEARAPWLARFIAYSLSLTFTRSRGKRQINTCSPSDETKGMLNQLR